MSQRSTVFHDGERLVQAEAGVLEEAARRGDFMIKPQLRMGAHYFIATVPAAIVSSVDREGNVWTSMLSSSDSSKPAAVALSDELLLFEAPHAHPDDPLREALLLDGGPWYESSGQLGMVFLNYNERNRFRVNGDVRPVRDAEDGSFELVLREAFGNCPKFITRRVPDVELNATATKPQAAGEASRATRLSPAQIQLVREASTFFLGTFAPEKGADANHRGGDPGFVVVSNDGASLSWPDYPGNNMFQSLGNIVAYDSAGLLFPNYQDGSALQISGKAVVDFHPTPEERAAGADGRVVRFAVKHVVELQHAHPYSYKHIELSPANPKLPTSKGTATPLRLVRTTREADDIVTFTWEAQRDLPACEPGQYGIFNLEIDGQLVQRSWTITTHSARQLSISVKREPNGLASRFLHSLVTVSESERTAAASVQLVAIDGDFQLSLRGKSRDVVFLSGGIGITPLLAMARAAESEQLDVNIHFFHSSRTLAQLPFQGELSSLTRVLWQPRVTRERPPPASGVLSGRLDAPTLAHELAQRRVSISNAHFFACGPDAFLASMGAIVSSLGAQPQRWHTESFDF